VLICLFNNFIQEWSVIPTEITQTEPWPTNSFFRLSCCSVHSSCQILVPQYLMNGLNNFHKTDWEYSIAPTDDLIRFWRSKIKVTAGHVVTKVSTSMSQHQSPPSSYFCTFITCFHYINHFLRSVSQQQLKPPRLRNECGRHSFIHIAHSLEWYTACNLELPIFDYLQTLSQISSRVTVPNC